MASNHIYPEYYESFACLAGDCTMTCCQEWEIAVDPRTRKKWEEHHLNPAAPLYLSEPNTPMTGLRKLSAAGELPENIGLQESVGSSLPRLSDSLEPAPGGRRKIRLGSDHRCPWLEPNGLCRIVLTYGEEMLSHTCHVYPRFVRHSYGPEEHGLYNSCPAVLDILRERGHFRMVRRADAVPTAADPTAVSAQASATSSSDAFSRTPAAPSASFYNPCSMVRDDRLTPAALLAVRDGVCSLLSDARFTPEQGLMTAFLILTELWEKEDIPGEAAQILQTLYNPEEYLSLFKGRGSDSSYPEASFTENNDLFLDLCQKHHDGGYYADVLEPLWQAAMEVSRNDALPEDSSSYSDPPAENSFSGTPSMNGDSASRSASAVSPLTPDFLHAFLAAECYNELLPETPDLTAAIRKLEWIMLRYAVIRHGCMLAQINSRRAKSTSPETAENLTLTDSDVCSPGNEPAWSMIRSIICTISRITACSDHDIEEYLDSMFDDPVWEPGYVLLLLGISPARS